LDKQPDKRMSMEDDAVKMARFIIDQATHSDECCHLLVSGPAPCICGLEQAQEVAFRVTDRSGTPQRSEEYSEEPDPTKEGNAQNN
jgi:hypothetical protein